MLKINFLVVFILFYFKSLISYSQEKTYKLVDSLTNKAIPYANIIFSNQEGIISDKNGYFKLIDEHFFTNDSIYISYLGYNPRSFSLNKMNDSIIKILSEPIMLDDIILTNNSLSGKEIMSFVKKNIYLNYPNLFSNTKLFFSVKNNQRIEKLKINNFKSSIYKLNLSLLDSMLILLPDENKYLMESLSVFNNSVDKKKSKINLIKSRETFKKDDFMDAFQKKLKNILENNLKSDSYYKIKSGIFKGDLELEGLDFLKDTIDPNIRKKRDSINLERDIKKQKKFANYVKEELNSLYSSLIHEKDSKFNVLIKLNRYKYEIVDMSYLGNELCYIISFQPISNETYHGTLYVNSKDYSVMRFDYKNLKPLFKIKLFGIGVNIFKNEGRMIFSKNNYGYSLRYLYQDSSTRFSFNRPLKFIEKNKNVKGRRKQNEISMDFELVSLNNSIKEVRVLRDSVINDNDFNKIEESNNILPQYLDEFKTNFWEEYKEEKDFK